MSRSMSLTPEKLLPVITSIWMETAAGPAALSLSAHINKYPIEVQNWRGNISKALLSMGVLRLVGKEGRVFVFQWNNAVYGAPSLILCKKIIDDVREQRSVSNRRNYNVKVGKEVTVSPNRIWNNNPYNGTALRNVTTSELIEELKRRKYIVRPI